jgi:hypothetical protein
LAEELLNVFDEADTNGDGLISRAESRILFPSLTEAQFDALDTNGDGFLSRAELEAGSPGGCFAPGSGGDFFLFGIVIYFFSLCERVVRFPLRWWDYFWAAMRGDDDGAADDRR